MKLISKFIWTCKGARTAKTILKKHRVEGFTLHDFRTYYKATVNRTVWHWHKDRHIDQQNTIKSQEINLYIYGDLIFNKDSKMPMKK